MGQKKRLHEELNEGRVPCGMFVPFASAPLVEIAGAVGYDFIIVDTEHGATNSESVESLIRAADVVGVDCVVRVPQHAYAEAQRAMDAGAAGILAPHVTTADEARALAEATHFPPRGRRGFAGTARSGGYGLLDKATLLSRADEMVTMAQIEDVEAVANLDEIAAVPGIDLLFIGPADLAMSAGKDGVEYERYLADVIGEATSLGAKHAPLKVGCFARDAATAAQLMNQGIGLVALSAAGIVGTAFRAEYDQFAQQRSPHRAEPEPADDRSAATAGDHPNSAR